MMGMLFVYILKSSVCLAMFYLFYCLLLSRETFHRFNRIALLGILLLSCLLPLVEISVKQQMEMHQTLLSLEQWLLLADAMGEGTAQVQAQEITWIQMALALYLTGILFFAFRNMYSLCRLMLLLKSGRREPVDKYIPAKDKVILMVHDRQIAPFSWMKYIVISRKDLEENGREILIHEWAHIRNRHSWDLLVADICIFFQWFNPASWLLKQELQNIHEYEADETVINEGVDAKQYQLLLIKKAVGTRLYSMANSFNHSKLKKRITMMLKEKSSPWARLKYLYVLPVAAIAVTAFARPEVSSTVEEISAVKVNDLAAIVETKVVESAEAAPLIEAQPMDTLKRREKTAPPVKVEISSTTSEKLDSALYIVDGKEVNASILSAIDPDKIDHVEVLKGKAATDVYGEKGKNGAILITLKKKDLSVIGVNTVGFTSKKTISGLPGMKVYTPEGDLSNTEVYVDGVKVDMEGKDLNNVVPATNIQSVSISKSGENKGAIYIVTSSEHKGEGYTVAEKTQVLESTSAKEEIKIKGKVVDEKGEPVIAASVLIEGTKKGSVTDEEGRFVLSASKDAVLVAY